MAKRGELLPFTVRFRFEGQTEHARGAYATRETAEAIARSQEQIVGPRGETCEAWVVDRRSPEHGFLSCPSRCRCGFVPPYPEGSKSANRSVGHHIARARVVDRREQSR